MLGIAAFPGSTAPRLVDVPPPEPPGAGMVLCRTLELGICGTDREILKSARPQPPAGAQQLVLGHECLARVEAVGAGVVDVSVGDLVVPQVRRPIGAPRRRVDLLAAGEFVERGIIGADGFSTPYWLDEPQFLYHVPPDLTGLAVLTEPLTVVEKGVHEAVTVQRARLGPDAWQDPPPRVLVTGLGPIGFAGVVAAVRRGWPTTVYGRDPSDSARAQLVADLGARYVNDNEHPLDPADVQRDGFDLILECTGSDSVVLRSAAALAACGVMVWLGSTRDPEAKPHNIDKLVRDGLLRNHIFLGSVNAAPRDFLAALAGLAAWRESHGERLARLITARVSPHESLWHYEHREPQGIKTVVEF